MNRKHFLKAIGATATFLGLPLTSVSEMKNEQLKALIATPQQVAGSMVGYADAPIDKVKVGIIGLGNRGKTLLQMLYWLIENDKAEIVGLSDLLERNITAALKGLENHQKKKPATYTKGENDWQNLAKSEDVDLLLIATPWRWHTPMAIYGMQQGKHIASEVPIAYTLEDCYRLIKTAEETKRHCIMIENCCYNDEELFVLNMIRQGVFGDLTHAEGAYIHDLRKHMLDETYYQGQWRIRHHEKRNGNFYTTHGMGPISNYLSIGRGDTYQVLTSMSSREMSLSQAAKRTNSSYTTIACGDMNTTLLKTANGKTVMLQFDVHTGSPYSRINKVIGTRAVHAGYPSRLYIDKPEELKYWGHNWLDDRAYQSMKEQYTHPLIKKLKSVSEDYKQGHGGMDFVMMYRLITSLNKGVPLDQTVYDGVIWSAITPLSEASVIANSQTVDFPDFTGGTWQKERPLEIMRSL
ncbi:MAG: Gfo/Idh/MocA family oxidoreductase [Ekhidna sp.]|nr:Gfo/Idh/MocA family oxidoreductase [Ekhidna sp.]MBC6410283.1 Gfo/Idh/MocA family oxidoreductase [Ekhidna sp.]MBC6425342.1 Gfo/Idh/MocA family oxidoreductase [Ekhidna sp.]